MRVCHLTTIHSPFDVRIFEKECRTLADAGHDVHLVVHDPPVAAALPADAPRVTFHPLPPRAPHWAARIARRLRAAARAALAVDARVYHLHDCELIPVGLWLKACGKTVIYDVHEDSPREALAIARTLGQPLRGAARAALWGGFDAFARAAFEGFVCATEAIARRFPPLRTVCVRNYPRWAELGHIGSGRNQTDRAPRILYLGGLTRVRGILQLLDAMEALPAGLGARLVLAGRWEPAALAAEAARHAAWPAVEYVGWQDRAGVRALLESSRIGVVCLQPEPTYVESLPVKLFEYMAAGLPVVASAFPIWRQIVAGAGCGLTVDPTDPRAIAAAITSLLSDPIAAAAMGARGRDAVVTRYRWEAEAPVLLDLYARLAAAGPDGARRSPTTSQSVPTQTSA